ncbi:MAG: nucleotidyltransferase family protein [bacterium]
MAGTPIISAILLAAGLSQRLGRNKLLLSPGGVPIVRRAAMALLDSRAAEVIVVTGHEAEKVRAALDELDVRFVHNPDYETGQGMSLLTGLAEAAREAEGYLFALGDQPFMTTRLIDRLIGAFGSSQAHVAAPFYKGRRGNPILISRELREDLLALGGDEGARSIVSRVQAESPDRFAAVEAASEALFWDIDTEEDYEKVLSGLRAAPPT